MRIKNKSKSERIKEAAIKDGISYISGLSKIPFPVEVIAELLRMRREDSPINFVDWKLKDWPERYRGELDRCLGLFYRGKELLLPQVLILDNTKKKFALSNVHFSYTKDPFKIPDNIRALTESPFEQLLHYLHKKTNYSNEENLRLVDIVETNKEVTLNVQPVNYEDYVHTNLVLDAKFKEKNQTLREYVHPTDKLEELNKSPLGNNLGINILLFTADGSLVLQMRSKSVAFYRGELFPSASGTVSLTDVPSTKITLRELPKLREAFEELGIKKDDTSGTSFLGITRELIRGGEPDMFFFAKSHLSEKEIVEKKWKTARDKWESKKLIFYHFGKITYENLNDKNKIHEFLSIVDGFIDRHIHEASMPLLTAIALWVKYRLDCAD